MGNFLEYGRSSTSLVSSGSLNVRWSERIRGEAFPLVNKFLRAALGLAADFCASRCWLAEESLRTGRTVAAEYPRSPCGQGFEILVYCNLFLFKNVLLVHCINFGIIYDLGVQFSVKIEKTPALEVSGQIFSCSWVLPGKANMADLRQDMESCAVKLFCPAFCVSNTEKEPLFMLSTN